MLKFKFVHFGMHMLLSDESLTTWLLCDVIVLCTHITKIKLCNSTMEPVNPDPGKYEHLYKTASYV